MFHVDESLEAVLVLNKDTDKGLLSNWIECNFAYSHKDNKLSGDIECRVAECDLVIALVTDLRCRQRN